MAALKSSPPALVEPLCLDNNATWLQTTTQLPAEENSLSNRGESGHGRCGGRIIMNREKRKDSLQKGS